MANRVEFYKLGGGGPAKALFTIWEFDTRVLASGPALDDAIAVLQRPVEVADRKIERKGKPLDWVAHLPAVYDRDALRATAPEREEGALLGVLQRERTLLAFKDAGEFFCFEGGAVRDARGQPITFPRYRRAIESEGWEELVPLGEILEAASPNLTPPSLDELTREFFGELERFRREYPNWTSLYRRGEVWRKVLFGTPPEQRPKHIQHVDLGLFGRIGERYYPRVEQDALGADQLWRLPAFPGAALTYVQASCTRVIGEGAASQALADLARLRIPTKIFLTRVPVEEAQARASAMRQVIEEAGGMVDGERYFILLPPPDEAATDPWHLVKSDPASGEPWLFSAWG